MRRVLRSVLLLACACAGTRGSDPPGKAPAPPPPHDAAPPTPHDSAVPPDSAADSGDGTTPVDHCAEVRAFGAEHAEVIATWTAQDDAAPWPAGGLVVVGSSSIRRWEGLAVAYTDHTVIQRGFGGAQLGEVAQAAPALVLRHDPAGVVVFAGTNDLAHGVAADVVTERLQCLVQQVRDTLPATVPVFFIGVTPTPARWEGWPLAEAFNRAAADLASTDPAFVYVDVPTAFLATGSPPDAALFVDDGLHLSAAGYALWDSVLRPAVDAVLPPTAPPPTTPLGPGTRLLVDLGPSDTTHGAPTPSPDYLGQHWNNWHPLSGGGTVLPGERRAALVADDGTPTAVELVVTGGFGTNGREHGGLRWPDPDRLGGLAVGTATEDFFYAQPDDTTGGLQLRGLPPDQTYQLRLFASRDHTEVRRTRYTATGATTATTTLQTSGPGAGTGTANDDTVATLSGLVPDPSGHLHLDVAIDTGAYAYLSALELTVEPAGLD